MTNLPDSYKSKRAVLGFDEISFGVVGIELLQLSEVEGVQAGYAEDAAGWEPEWIVIGNETACGDPLFLSDRPPHAVFTAMTGEEEWIAKMIAPSLQTFWDCLEVFRRFTQNRGNPVELAGNVKSEEEIEKYLAEISRLCRGSEEALEFWMVQAEIGMDEE